MRFVTLKTVMDLLEHHIEETRRQLDDVKAELKNIRDRLDDLHRFKADLIASSRTVSLIVSAVCGFITLIATTVATFVSLKK